MTNFKTRMGLAIIILAVPIPLLRSFVFTKLWAWFLVPLGLPAISIAWAFGILLAAFMVVGEPAMQPKPDGLSQENWTWSCIAKSMLTPLFALAFGAIAVSLM